MILLNKDHHSFNKQYKISLRYIFIAVTLLVIKVDLNLSLVTDGLCAETLGYAINNFLDDCLRGHHFFSAMRSYSLKNLYKINCCPGYREISRRARGEELKCQAVCTTPCHRGTCVRPETCECPVGYFLKTKYMCAPVCHPSCRNGQCVGIDDCSCNTGYMKINGSRSDCGPVCDLECVNGWCKSPGVCECNDGYSFKVGSNRICEPLCNPPCTNGVCSSPNMCQCTVGYSKVSDYNCEPLCQSGCGLGNCSAPHTCTCPDGYESQSGQPCQPTCQGCSGGTCVSPGVCYCPNGRTLDKESGECVRICNPPCLYGNCMDPGICICKEGYSMNSDSGFCEPVCNPNCTNGYCVKPDECKCLAGFETKSSTDKKCEPICSNPCENGTCIAPEICQCWEGYTQVSHNSCSPLCFYGCGPGTCISPNNCSCPHGYEATDDGSCMPICTQSCENGLCVKPDVCICSKGYSFDDTSGICKPFSEALGSLCASCKDCINGACNSPDTCTCLPGYNKRPDDPCVCLPELGQYFGEDPTLLLNVFHLPSAIKYLEDNETFSFAESPILSVHKNCNFLFQNTDVSTVNSSKYDFVQLNCALLEGASELNLELYCQWPLEGFFSSDSYGNTTSLRNVSLTEQNNLWNFSLSIEFPETLAAGETGHCSMCIQPPLVSKYFSVNELDDLLLLPCSQESLSGISFTVTGGTPITWVAVSCIFGTIILLTTGIVIFILRSFSWNLYQKTETNDTDGIPKTEVKKNCENQNNDGQGVLLLTNNFSIDECCPSSLVTEC